MEILGSEKCVKWCHRSSVTPKYYNNSQYKWPNVFLTLQEKEVICRLGEKKKNTDQAQQIYFGLILAWVNKL